MEGEQTNSRRSFLRNLGLLLSCQYALDEKVFAAPVKKVGKSPGKLLVKTAQPPAKPPAYKIAPWTGDDFTLGHKLRIADLPAFPEKAERELDFVIVGAGVAGLTAAYRLKDHDFLLLEQYEELGGQSRGSSYRGIDYSYGAAYIGEVDDEYGEFYSELGITPVALDVDRNAFWWDNKWAIGIDGNSGSGIYKEFKRLIAEATPIWNSLPPEMDPSKLGTAALQKLDQTLMSQCLLGYSKQFLGIIDSFCRSSLNAGIEQLSGLGAYGLLHDLVNTTHVFKGGNPAIARALASRIEQAGTNRCIKGSFVWKIELSEKSASVVYSTADGIVHRVNCKHVIVATSPLVAARQLVHVPDLVKAGLMSFRFGSYLVANVCMKKKVFNGPYDCFAAAPFSFSDITVAETPYLKTNSYKPEMGSVLTVYQPYAAGSEGRMVLFQGDKQKLASSITSQMDKITPGLLQNIDEVVLTRWGHALAIIGPGYFRKLEKLQNLADAPYSLAHSSVWGWPAAESAIRGGNLAAQRALKLSASISAPVG